MGWPLQLFCICELQHGDSERDMGVVRGGSRVSSLHDAGIVITRAEYHRPAEGRGLEAGSGVKDTSLDTTASSDRRQVKRKVLRWVRVIIKLKLKK